MRLEKFIEQDIREFLEQKAEREWEMETPGVMRGEEIGAFEFSRDYAEEMDEALRKGDLDEARQVFLDLKSQYDSFSEQSPEQRQAYSIMHELNEKVKKYLSRLPEGENNPKEPEDIGIVLPQWKSRKQSYKEQREQQIRQLKEEKQMKDALVAEISKNLQRIQKLLKKHDVVAAVILYRHIKQRFNRIPKRYNEERKELYDHLITAYYQIRKAAEDIGSDIDNSDIRMSEEKIQHAQKKADEIQGQEGTEQEEAGQEQQPRPQPQQDARQQSQQQADESEQLPDHPPSYGDDDNIEKEDVLAMLDEVRQLVREKKPREAYDVYKEAKRLFAQLDAPKNVKEELFKDIVAVHHSVKELEKHEVDKKKRPKMEEPMIQGQDEETDLDDDIRKAKLKAYRFLDHGDLESAIIQYDRLRELFDKLPPEAQDQRDRLHREIFEIHDQIMEKRKEDNFQNEDYEEGDHDCWEDIDKIKSLVKNDQVEKAEKLFLEVQHDVVKIDDPEERKELYKALDGLRSKLNLANTTRSLQERRAEA